MAEIIVGYSACPVREGKIRSTVTEQITLEAIPSALERLAGGHVRGKIVAKVQG